MKTINIISALLLSLILMGSCTERIDISTDDAPTRLSIYGYITADTMQHSIKITRSAGYFATTRPEGISHAVVSISTDDAVFQLTESTTEPGLYLTAANVFGIEGKTYTLNVALDFDNNGQQEQYQAQSYLPYSARLDSITLKQSTAHDNEIDILAFGMLPENQRGYDNYYSFHAIRNSIPVNDSLVGFSMVPDDMIGTSTIVAVTSFSLSQDGKGYWGYHDRGILQPGDTVTLRLDVFTKEYGDFITHAQAEVTGSIPMFSGPPANVETNIQKMNSSNMTPVSGFFSAYSGQKASTIYQPK